MPADSSELRSARSRWLRAVRLETAFAWWSRHFAWALLVGLAAGILSVTSLNQAALTEIGVFQDTAAEARADGVDVDAELRAPLRVQVDGDSTTVDHPVRYDYERAREALGLRQPAGYAANAAQSVGFLLSPLVAFGAGLTLTLKDLRHRTIRLRAIRFRLGQIESAYTLTAALLGIATAVAAIATALVAGPLSPRPTKPGLSPAVFEPIPNAVGLGGAAAWACFAVASSFFFAACGVSVGVITRALVAPMAVFTAFHLVAPILGPWDPRAMIQSVGAALHPINGTLHLRPPSGALPPDWSLVLLAAQALALLLLARIALAARPRWGAP